MTIAYFKPEIRTDKINQKLKNVAHKFNFLLLKSVQIEITGKNSGITASGHSPFYTTNHCYQQKLESEYATIEMNENNNISQQIN